MIRAEHPRKCQFVRIRFESGNDNGARPDLTAGNHTGKPALARPEDHNRISRLRLWHLHRPAESGAERIEDHTDLGRKPVGHRMHHRIGMQIHVLGIATPQAGCLRGRYIGVDLAMIAEVIAAAQAGLAMATGNHGFHRHPVPDIHSPALRGLITDAGYSAQGFMAGYHRGRRAQQPFILLVVAAADTTGFEFEQRRIRIDVRNRNIPRLECARPGLHHGKGRSG